MILNFIPSPPGDTISDIMQERGMTNEEICELLDISSRELSQLLAGVLEIDSDLAYKLSTVLGSTYEFWGNREKNYRAGIKAGDFDE